MKQILLLFILMSASIYGQEVELTVTNLSGKWEFSDIKSDKHTAQDIAERKELLQGTVLTFNADGTCITDIIMEVEGKWTLDSTKKEIKTIDRRGENIWYVQSLTQDKAILSRNQKDFKIEFVKK